MENENMHSSTPQLARRSAVTGVSPRIGVVPGVATYANLRKWHQTRMEKEQPVLPPDTAQAATEIPSTPTSATRGAQRPPQKTSSRSLPVDPSMLAASAPKQAEQPSAPSAPPGLPNPVTSTPSTPSAPAQRTPIEEWVTIGQPSAFIEELKAKVANLEAEMKEKDAKIKKQRDSLAHFLNKCQNLESEPYRQEVLSIRRHLQVDESCEPWEINKKFGEIVRKVEDISRDMGEELGSLQPIGKHTTLDLLKLVSRAPEGQGLAAATPTVDLDLEDFVDFGCRALINEALFNGILGPSVFHPGLKPEDNAFYCDLYNQIRHQEPQVIAGRWRVSTYKLHAKDPYSPKDGAFHLCQNILLPFCSAVVESKPCLELIQSKLSQLEGLFKRAYDWHHLVKSSVIMLDFHPRFQLPGTLYDVHNTLLEGRRPKLPASKAILLTSKLGLWSSSAVGGGKDPEFSCQTKTTMLAAEYFVT